MGTQVLHPNGYGPGTGGWGVGGGGAIHTNLADSNDATYDTAPATLNYVHIGFDNLSIPAYAQIRSVTATMRLAGNAGSQLAAQFGVSGKWAFFMAFYKPPVAITTVAFPSVGKAPDGGPWTQSKVNSMEMSIGSWSPVKIYEAWVTVAYDEAPAVTVTAPIGTLTVGNTPVVTWNYSDPENASQEQVQVSLFTDAQVRAKGFSPDTVTPFWTTTKRTSSPNLTITQPLAAGVWYVYVRASDQGSNGRFGPWDGQVFSVAGAPPAMPLLAAAPDAANRRNILTVTGQDNLLSYNQAGFESTDGSGWYINAAAGLTFGTSTSTDLEGINVLKITSTAASAASVRSGGAWGTLIGSIGSIVIHSSTPARKTGYTGSLTTATFTPPAGALLLACAGLQYWGGPVNVGSSISDSTGRTWTQIDKVSNPGTGGTPSPYGDEAIIWRAVATGSAMTVTLTATIDNTHEKFLRVLVITGQHATPASSIGAHGTNWALTGMTQTYVSTAANSRGFAMWVNDLRLQVPSAATGCAIEQQWVGRRNQFATIKRLAPTSPVASTVPISLAGPTSNTHSTWCYAEVVPSVTPPAGTPLAAIAGIPVTAGTSYQLVASAWQQSNAVRNARVDVEFYDATGTLLSTDTGSTFATLTTSLFAATTRTITAPASCVAAVLILVFVNPSGAGEIMQWDRVGLMPAGNDHWTRGGVTTENILTADTGSQQVTLGDWVVETVEAGTSVARTADVTVLSGQVAKLTLAAASVGNGIKTSTYPVIPGLSYTVSAYVKKGNADYYEHTARIVFLDGNGAEIISAVGDPVDGSSTTWTGPVWTTLTAPDNADSVQVHLLTSLAAAASHFSSWTRIQLTAYSTPQTAPPTSWQPGPMAIGYPYAEFSDDGGTTWDVVRFTTDAIYDPDTQIATVYDYEAPPGGTRTYRASTAAIDYALDPTGGLVVNSDVTNTIDVALSASDWWMKDPLLPGIMIDVDIQGDLKWTRKRRQGIYSPLGRTRPVVVFDEAEGRETTTDIWLFSEGDKNLFEDMLESGRTLLLQGDMGQQWYVQIADSSDWTLVNAPGRLLGTPIYQTTVKLIEVDRPL